MWFNEFTFYYYFMRDIVPNANFVSEYANDCKLIFPELFLVTSILILIIYGSLIATLIKFNFPLINRTMSWLTLLVLVLLLILIINSYCFYFINMQSSGNFAFNNTLIFDDIAIFSKVVLVLFSMICILMIQNYVVKYQLNAFEYFILLLLSVLGSILLCSSFDLITTYLAIELQSLSFYVLASFKRESSFSTEAGLKYFILGSFSSGLLLFGTSFIYGYFGTTNFGDINQLSMFVGDSYNYSKIIAYVSTIVVVELDTFYGLFDDFTKTRDLDSFYISPSSCYINFLVNSSGLLAKHSIMLIYLSIFFIASALLFKIGAAPYHMWSPDVYEGSPTSSTIFFAIMPKLALFVVIVRVFHYSFSDFIGFTKQFLIIAAILSVIVGSFISLKQRKIKRLLAYSSIGHVGYLLIAACSGNLEGNHSLFFYLFIYMITSIGLWSVVLINEPVKDHSSSYQYTTKTLSDLSGLIKSNLTLSFTFSMFLFSLAGIPPLAGFYAKLLVFFIAIESNMFVLALIGVLSSVISAYYYLRIIKIMCFDKKITTHALLDNTIDYQKALVLGLSLFFLFFLFLESNFISLICYKMGSMSPTIVSNIVFEKLVYKNN